MKEHFDCFRCGEPVNRQGICSCKDGICLINGDSQRVMEYLDSSIIDLVMTDPPYGIQAAEKRHHKSATKWEGIEGDISNDLAAFLLKWVTEHDLLAVIWGARNWPELLPHKGRWFCWDKRCQEWRKGYGADFELAWCSAKSGFDLMIRVKHVGWINADAKRFGEKRRHPTQKPVALFSAILKEYEKAQVVFDPFAGTGTSLVASRDMGRCAIGVELKREFCEVAADFLSIPSLGVRSLVQEPMSLGLKQGK